MRAGGHYGELPKPMTSVAKSDGRGKDNHGALAICLHAGGNPASVKTGFGLLGGGCSVDSLNQKLSSLPQPSLGSGGGGGLASPLSCREGNLGLKKAGWARHGRTLVKPLLSSPRL